MEDTTGRKVYDQNGTFAEHLLNLPADRVADLLPGADGKPRPSLVNTLRLRRAIVIVPLDQNETDKLVGCVTTPEAKAKVAEVAARVREAEKAFGGSGRTRVPSP